MDVLNSAVMNIILGATGQVGSMLLNEISQSGNQVRAVVRDIGKVKNASCEVRQADLLDVNQLTEAVRGGETIFLLTPENPSSTEILADTARIVENYRKAIMTTGIKRIVALSCVGAQVEEGTGNVLMSRILEEGIHDLDAEKVIVRPSYYYSNWLGFMEPVEQYGVLPTFFPADLKIDMHSPIDLAKFIAKVMIDEQVLDTRTIYELTGPQKYCSADVATAFSEILGKEVEAQQIPPEQWKENLHEAGFSDDAAKNLSDMTQAVIDGLMVPEYPEKTINLTSTIKNYFKEKLS